MPLGAFKAALMGAAGSSFEGMVATGGAITTDGDYKVHSFTSSGTFEVTTLGSLATIDYLLVAGGAGGASSASNSSVDSGGGGAGGYRYFTDTTVTASEYTITVGSGGATQSSNASQGNDGSLSRIAGTFTTSASGGGGGGARSGTTTGRSGGSGGGAAGYKV